MWKLTVVSIVLIIAGGAWAVAPSLAGSNADRGNGVAAPEQRDSYTTLVNWLGGQIAAAVSALWLAYDYTPTAAVSVVRLTMDYIYQTTQSKSTLNFRLYSGTNPGVGSIVATWSVPPANYTETNTGRTWFGHTVWRATIPIPPQSLMANLRYWFAYQSATPANVYWICRPDTYGADMLWVFTGSSWGSSEAKGLGVLEQSFMIEGGVTGVTPASLGRVKALFR